MDKADIRQLLEEKAHRIKKLCSRIMPAFDPEDIHKFRVEIKKLRAFLRFLQTVPRQEEISLPKKLKHLYDIAGIIRDQQLQIQQIEALTAKTPAYIAHINRSIAKQKREWEIYYSDRATAKLEEKIKHAELHKIPDTALGDFIQKYLTDIRNIILNPPDEEEIHAVRKHVKDMMYNIKYAEENWPKAVQHLHQVNTKKLDTLAELIGNYHDTSVMHDHLQVFLATPHAHEEVYAINRLIKQQEEKLSKTRPEVLQQITVFASTY